MKKPRYTKNELEHLRILFRQKKTDEEIAKIMNRPVIGIQEKRRKLGLHRPNAVQLNMKHCHQWTEDELQFIRNYWREKTDDWMAKKLGVSVSSYKHKRYRMKRKTLTGRMVDDRLVKTWTRHKGRHKTWTFNQEEFLRENYPTHSAKDLARYLGRNENAVQWKARRMGLKKAYRCGRRGYEPVEKYYDKETFVPQLIK